MQSPCGNMYSGYDKKDVNVLLGFRVCVVQTKRSGCICLMWKSNDKFQAVAPMKYHYIEYMYCSSPGDSVRST